MRDKEQRRTKCSKRKPDGRKRDRIREKEKNECSGFSDKTWNNKTTGEA